MNGEHKSPDLREKLGDDSDVEILEVVGVAEDAPALAASPPARAAEAPSLDEGSKIRSRGEELLTSEQRFLRMRADYDNLRKRIERERDQYEQHANSLLVSRLLPVLDDFERAMNLKSHESVTGPFQEGVLLIYKRLMDELRKEGLSPIDSLGRRFDPSVHDAVATDAGREETSNIVVEELQRGYLFRNRLLRPALVKVSTHAADDSSDEAS
jgi:molecular chaperone GrpE